MIKLITGDCREVLKTLPDESVHCVVTSPPYWGLRDYGVAGQLGLEQSLSEHVQTMVQVFREVRRVLRKDGTLWLNYGDSYAASVNGRSAALTKQLGNDDRTFRDKPFSTIGPIYIQECERDRRGESQNKGNESSKHGGRIIEGGFLKAKDLCGIPWRVAFALQEDGWWLRQDIIWSKPNPMPESVTDRCTKAHEYLFLLAKSERYYYDAEAIKEEIAPSQVGRVRDDIIGGTSWSARGQHSKGGRFLSSMAETAEAQAGTRNRRSVWEVTTQPFSEAHFATFPPALIEPCIKAGTSEKGCCSKCGASWKRDVDRQTMIIDRSDRTHELGHTRSSGTMIEPARSETIGWSSSCKCDADIVPCVVLDPFGGAGTTGLVADRLGREAILIELNPEYVALAERRIKGDAPLFTKVEVNALSARVDRQD